MKKRILIADDHSIVRSGIRYLLSARNDVEIVGEADNGLSAISLARKLKPDMILMDIAMPQMNGVEAIQEIVREAKETKVLVLSMHSDDRMVSRAMKAGAKGYLIKDCDSKELNEAINALSAGDVYLSKELSSALIHGYIEKLVNDIPGTSILTPKERQILQMIAEGNTTKDIAALLNVSIKTVEVHRSNIMRKLNLHNIADLTKYAIREGLTHIT